MIIESSIPHRDIELLPRTAQELFEFLVNRYGNEDQPELFRHFIHGIQFGGKNIHDVVNKWTYAISHCRAAGIDIDERMSILFFVTAIDVSKQDDHWVYNARQSAREGE